MKLLFFKLFIWISNSITSSFFSSHFYSIVSIFIIKIWISFVVFSRLYLLLPFSSPSLHIQASSSICFIFKNEKKKENEEGHMYIWYTYMYVYTSPKQKKNTYLCTKNIDLIQVMRQSRLTFSLVSFVLFLFCHFINRLNTFK